MTKHDTQKEKSSPNGKESTVLYSLNDEITVYFYFFVFFKFSQRFLFLPEGKEKLLFKTHRKTDEEKVRVSLQQ